LAWLGVPAQDPDAMIRFFRDALGLSVAFGEPTSTELSLPNDDRVQVFGPGDRYFDLYERFGAGPVALFEVDDVESARAELAAAGVEVTGPTESDDRWAWIHVRAPDGRLYALASRLPETDR
jgi:predicted enzyme related to lactoylglutathione lyase